MLAQIVLFDGFDLLDAVAPYEVLTAAADAAPGHLTVQLVSAEGARAVPSGAGPTLPAEGPIDLLRARLLVVPGASGALGGDGPDTIPARLMAAMATALPAQLVAAAATPGVTLASVCGGAMLLGFAGLLRDRPAVTHHLAMGPLGVEPEAA